LISGPGTGLNPSTLRDKSGKGSTSEGKAFEFSYDKLLLATGSRANIPDLPGVDLPGVFALKSLEDGRRIKQHIAKGPVRKSGHNRHGVHCALEMCEALREEGLKWTW
jgi:CoA-dependent NAD(P)H sulfur oxidoreductase